MLAVATFQLERNNNRDKQRRDMIVTTQIYERMKKDEHGHEEQESNLQQDVNNLKASCTRICIWDILRNFGWALLGLSQLISRDKMGLWNLEPCGMLASALFFLMGLSSCHTRLKYMPWSLSSRRSIWLPWASTGWILQGLILLFDRNNGPWFYKVCFLVGSSFIAFSPLVFDWAQLAEWDPDQRSENVDEERELVDPSRSFDPTVFHLGAPLLAFGMFWFWIGTNAVDANATMISPALPLFLTGTSLLTYGGAIVAFLVWWSAAYALDEMPWIQVSSNENFAIGSDIESNSSSVTLSADQRAALAKALHEFEQKSPGFGFAGRFFGTMKQSKIAIPATWALYSIVSFYPYMISNWWPFSLTLDTLFFGLYLTGFQERAAMRELMPSVAFVHAHAEQLLRGSLACFLIVWTVQLWGDPDYQDGWSVLVLACLGAILFARGEFNVHRNRKRGYCGKVLSDHPYNRDVSAYSYGSLQMPLGMLFMSWAMSIRANLAS